MKKYEFIKEGLDDWILKYKDKEIKFKTDVDLISKAQKMQKEARVKMIMDLSKQGITPKELVIERKENGKTFIDSTNKDELEKIYIEEETSAFFDNTCKEKFGMGFVQLMQDIEIVGEEEGVDFANKLSYALTGQKNPEDKFPS